MTTTTTTTHSAGDWCDVIDTSVNLVPYRTSPKDGRFGTKTCNLCSFLGVFSDCNIFNFISWITFQKLRSDRTALRLSISEASKYFFRERRQAVQRNCEEAEQNQSYLSLWVYIYVHDQLTKLRLFALWWGHRWLVPGIFFVHRYNFIINLMGQRFSRTVSHCICIYAALEKAAPVKTWLLKQ